MNCFDCAALGDHVDAVAICADCAAAARRWRSAGSIASPRTRHAYHSDGECGFDREVRARAERRPASAGSAVAVTYWPSGGYPAFAFCP